MYLPHKGTEGVSRVGSIGVSQNASKVLKLVVNCKVWDSSGAASGSEAELKTRFVTHSIPREDHLAGHGRGGVSS